ncbi:MAG: hypothetical protein R3F59_30590 [Myxococcota bacterium]
MLLWTVALTTLAGAQEPAAPAEPAPAGPETLYVTQDTPSVRFLGQDVAGSEFSAGDAVTVLVRDQGKVRVFTDDKFGWVDPGVLSATAPAPVGGLTMPAGGASGLLGGLPPLLDKPPAPSGGAPAPR